MEDPTQSIVIGVRGVETNAARATMLYIESGLPGKSLLVDTGKVKSIALVEHR